MSTEKTIAERIKLLEKEISNAETRISLHEKRLTELKKEVNSLETECKNELDLSIKQLPDFIKTNEVKIEKLLKELEDERDKINEGQEE
jgi:septal ring factor EnvC (AmiA/AmiB activator)